MGLSKIRQFIFILLLMYILFIQAVQAYSPPSCEYGTCDAWVSFDGKLWENTTIDFKELNRGQPFYIKTNISTNQKDILVSMYFYETAVYTTDQASFEIVDGYIEGIINHSPDMVHEFGIINQSSSFESIWEIKVREYASWWNGLTPLNIHAGFYKRNQNNLYDWIGDDIHYTLVNVYINKTRVQLEQNNTVTLLDSNNYYHTLK
jgi:hypothetical protein